jgi:hypothetical protein
LVIPTLDAVTEGVIQQGVEVPEHASIRG